MKTKTVLWMIIVLSFFTGMGCEKEALPPNQAKGKIIGITGSCLGNGVYIEVENPNGIGRKGREIPAGSGRVWNYENAIRVPYFQRIGLPPELMKEETWLYFEYRELTEEDRKQELFQPDEPVICLANQIPPPASIYIITKIISHKP